MEKKYIYFFKSNTIINVSSDLVAHSRKNSALKKRTTELIAKLALTWETVSLL